MAFRGGELDPLGTFGRHCAACEGTVTIVLVVFWFCNAILRRFARLEFCDSWVFVAVVDVVTCKVSNDLLMYTFALPWISGTCFRRQGRSRRSLTCVQSAIRGYA